MLKEAARQGLVTKYKAGRAGYCFGVWEAERPFELHLDGVTVTGRADVILDNEGILDNDVILDNESGTASAHAMADYKTSNDDSALAHDLQLRSSMQRRGSVPGSTGSRPGARCRRCEVQTVCGSARR